MHMQCIHSPVCLGVAAWEAHQQLMNNIPAVYPPPLSRLGFGCTLDIGICESLSKPNIKLLLKSRKLINMSVLCIPRKCATHSVFGMAMVRVHTLLVFFSITAVKCNLCILYYCILCYCMYSMLYYQYHIACPRTKLIKFAMHGEVAV